MKGVYLFLADGFEDIEALATHDVLRRGGVPLQLVSISEDPFVVSSHGLTIGAEAFLPDLEISHAGTTEKDLMIFPGGMPGTKHLAACKPLVAAMKAHYAAGGSLAAICAAPGLVLGQLDDLSGVTFTCFDGFATLPESKGAVFAPKAAIRSGRIITGRSAGHAVAFALEILRFLRPEKYEEVREALFLQWTA
ncbi:MAG: DJ-1/PfpI family protein [Bacteroidales bacterium]|nr:DJ-1/PfpI family protein [Bacteroidales bacterium]